MEKNKIEEIARNYLSSLNIRVKPKNKKDKFRFYVKELNNFFYIECDFEYYKGTCCPAQAEGYPAENYQVKNYGFVLDSEGNVVIDLVTVSSFAFRASQLLLDEKNIIIPIKNEGKSDSLDYANNYRHFRIEDGNLKLISILSGTPNTSNSLLRNKLLGLASGELYNFEKGIIVSNPLVDKFLITEENLRTLAHYWEIENFEQQYLGRVSDDHQFSSIIFEKMERENLIGGYKKIQKQKGDFSKEYHTFAFIDGNGNIVDDSLYYWDGDKCELMLVSGERDIILQQLEEELELKINEQIEKSKRKKNLIKDVKLKMKTKM